MTPDPEKEFEKNMSQLVQLLKKIMAGSKNLGPYTDMPNMAKGQGMNINLCFFSFFPVTPEEMDEFEDLYEQFLSEEDKKGHELKPEWTVSDLEFLRRHGIQF